LKVKMGVVEGGKASETLVRVEARFRRDLPWRGPELALVRCWPITGRQHQIRVHLAAAGHPIVGDKLYGPSARHSVDFAEGRLTEEARAELVLERHALHAAALAFPHPSTGEPLRVEAPLPDDMAELVSPYVPRATG